MKILLAIDGSEYTSLTEALLAKVVNPATDQVTIACVVPPPHVYYSAMEPFGGFSMVEQAEVIVEQSRQHADRVLAESAARLNGLQVTAATTRLEGEVGSTLLEYLEKHSFDLVVVGSRGFGGLKGLIFGSVARKLVYNSPCSVLVARAWDALDVESTTKRLVGAKKLSWLVGVDGSPGSKSALSLLQTLGRDRCNQIVAVCAQPLSALPAGIDPGSFTEFYDYDSNLAENIVTTAVSGLQGAGDEILGETAMSRPADLIISSAKKHQTDVIVMSATRHGFLERTLIGSVSAEVVNDSPCSVWVVREKTDQ